MQKLLLNRKSLKYLLLHEKPGSITLLGRMQQAHLTFRKFHSPITIPYILNKMKNLKFVN